MLPCKGECGAKVADDEAATAAGWEYLSISGKYRCGKCTRELRAAGRMVGTEPGIFVDPLPADSRGALPKETASSISAPTVKPTTGSAT